VKPFLVGPSLRKGTGRRGFSSPYGKNHTFPKGFPEPLGRAFRERDLLFFPWELLIYYFYDAIRGITSIKMTFSGRGEPVSFGSKPEREFLLSEG